mgnify:CR=1 FL=1
MWSSTVRSNCCVLGVRVAVADAIILAPFDGGGGGPLLDDAGCVSIVGPGPWPPELCRGIPPPGGWPGGGFVKLCDWCLPGLSALSSASLVDAAFSVFCWACSFAMFALSFSRSKNSASSYRVNCWVRLKIVAVRSGSAILSLGSKIVSFTNVS